MAGKKNRKFGRIGKRSGAQQRYNAEQRWDVNKKKRIAKEAKKQASPKKMAVPRGTMRAYKRQNITQQGAA